eukprot:12814373-Alexandrium_andersonii.AAC.1
MSASLVGSEMCIRDSAESDAQAGRSTSLFTRLTSASIERCLAHDFGGPVSYTHLTLPTICSV